MQSITEERRDDLLDLMDKIEAKISRKGLSDGERASVYASLLFKCYAEEGMSAAEVVLSLVEGYGDFLKQLKLRMSEEEISD